LGIRIPVVRLVVTFYFITAKLLKLSRITKLMGDIPPSDTTGTHKNDVFSFSSSVLLFSIQFFNH
jgi:hypothetical protein